MVRQVAERKAANPAVGSVIKDISNLVKCGGRSIQSANWSLLGSIMNQNHAALQELGVSTHELDNLCLALLDHGALGAKLTGSGGGGCAIALFEERSVADTAATFLSQKFSTCFAFSTAAQIESAGV